MLKNCGSLKTGDAVPEWMLTADPVTPCAQHPDIRFCHDVYIVENDAGYFVVPNSMPVESYIGNYILYVGLRERHKGGDRPAINASSEMGVRRGRI